MEPDLSDLRHLWHVPPKPVRAPLIDDGLGCDGMHDTLAGGRAYDFQCFGCARPHRVTVAQCVPAVSMVMLHGERHPVAACLHRIHEPNDPPTQGLDKSLSRGGVHLSTIGLRGFE